MQLNIKVVSETGEDHSVLSRSALEGAVNRPQTLHHYEACNDVIALGVRLIAGIAKDHCFVQGNKRTAFHAGIVFMELNDAFLDLPDTETTAKWVEDLVTGDVSETDVADALRKRRM